MSSCRRRIADGAPGVVFACLTTSCYAIEWCSSTVNGGNQSIIFLYIVIVSSTCIMRPSLAEATLHGRSTISGVGAFVDECNNFQLPTQEDGGGRQLGRKNAISRPIAFCNSSITY